MSRVERFSVDSVPGGCGDADAPCMSPDVDGEYVTHEDYEDLKKILAMGVEVVEDFLPNVAQCALQDYGRLNQFMIDSEAALKEGETS